MAYVIGIYDEDKNIEIKLFSNSDNVLDKYKELNLFFLVLEMSELNGLLLKKKLEYLDFKGSIR